MSFSRTRSSQSIFDDRRDNVSAQGTRGPRQAGTSGRATRATPSTGRVYDALLAVDPQVLQNIMPVASPPSTQTNQRQPLSAPTVPTASTPYVIAPSPTSTSQPTYTSTYSSAPTYTSTYSSSVDSQGNITVPGLGTFTPQQVYDWATTTDPATIASTLQQYGVDPAQLVNVYNIAAPTDVTYQQASEYLGIPVSTNQTNSQNNSYNNPGYVPFTTSYSSTVDVYGNIQVPGLGTFTPAQVFDWARTTDPAVIAQTLMQYGVSPAQVVDAYNLEARRRGEPTVTYEQAEEFLGIPVSPQGGGQPSNTTPSINIPTDVFPSSESASESHQSGSSISGIDWTGPVASQVLPEIPSVISSIMQLPSTAGQEAIGLADDYAVQQDAMVQQLLQSLSTAYSSGSSALQQAMQSASQGVEQAYGTASELERAARYAARQAAQSNYGLNNVLQQLNAIGMLNSTTGANVMSQALGEVLRGLSQQAYQASAQGQQAIQDALRAQAQIASGVGAAYAPLGQMVTGGYGTAGSMADQAAQRQLQAREFTANIVGSLIPQALAALAGLDKYSLSQYESSSTGASSSSDPLAPWRLIIDMMGLMS